MGLEPRHVIGWFWRLTLFVVAACVVVVFWQLVAGKIRHGLWIAPLPAAGAGFIFGLRSPPRRAIFFGLALLGIWSASFGWYAIYSARFERIFEASLEEKNRIEAKEVLELIARSDGRVGDQLGRSSPQPNVKPSHWAICQLAFQDAWNRKWTCLLLQVLSILCAVQAGRLVQAPPS